MSTPVVGPSDLVVAIRPGCRGVTPSAPDVSSVTPLTLPEPNGLHLEGLLSVSTAAMPAAAPPIAIAGYCRPRQYTTEPVTFLVLPPMTTWPGGGAGLLRRACRGRVSPLPVVDLLLEHPEDLRPE